MNRFLKRFSRKSQPQISAATLHPFDLDQPLLVFGNDAWRIRDACEGTQIFGATGSGKTSGSGKAIAKAFLASGFGGLILTAKPDERELWQRYASETGRENHLIIFSPSESWRFNFLDYEMNRSGAGAGQTENIVNLFSAVLEIAERRESASGSDSFWDRTVKDLLRNTIELLSLAKGSISLPEMRKIILSAPKNVQEIADATWQQNSLCWQLLEAAQAKEKTPLEENDFEQTADYWLSEFPNLAAKTRSIIVTSFSSMASIFLRGQLRELFCTSTNVFPEDTHNGALILIDMPVQEWRELGLFSQVVFKYLWQRAAERRKVSDDSRPVFLWADESQNFVTSYDSHFQSVSRSARVCSVYLTQNFPNYLRMLPGGKGQAEIHSLLGNFQTKIFHANTEQTTNQYASDIIAKSRQIKSSFSSSTSDNEQGSSHQTGISGSEQIEYEVLPRDFTTLLKGGRDNNFIVEGILFQGGRIWPANNKNHLHIQFDQRR